MTELADPVTGVAEASDTELISLARSRDDRALAELYRRHRDPAFRLARRMSDPTTADDLVSDAFLKVFQALGDGKGPTTAFRPYLLTTVRNLYVSQLRQGARVVTVDSYDAFADLMTHDDDAAAGQESQLLARAFRSLPERWQAVLWHTTVEGDDHETVGRLLGIKANAVAALAFRAREGLRRSYLAAHLAAVPHEECEPVREQLPAYVRGRLRKRHRVALEEHLRTCLGCTAAVVEIDAINNDLGVVLAGVLLGGAGIGRLAAPAQLPGSTVGGQLGLWTAVAAASAVLVAATVGTVAVATGEDGPVGPTPSAGSSPRGGEHEHVVRRGPVVRPARTGPAAPVTSPRPTNAPSPASRPASRPDQPVLRDRPPATSTSVWSAASQPTTEEPDVEPPRQPAPVPTPTPAPVTTEDLVLGWASSTAYRAFVHLQVEVATPVASTLVFEIAGLESHDVHDELAFGRTSCSSSPGATGPTVLSCDLPAGAGPFAIDVTVVGPWSATARIVAADNADPDPGNDVVTFTEPS